MTLLEIVKAVKPSLKKIDAIHAMWLEGSYATGAFGPNSDIDVWLDVEDGSQSDCYQLFKDALTELGYLREAEPLNHYSDNPFLVKAKFYLHGMSDDQRIELDMQQHSRKFIFSKAEHTITVLFDKDNTIRWRQ